ncbi:MULTISPECIES: FAD/NAD(P)-binding oxidoreductase [Acidobacterium]|uniref:Pyridine nucleotide-disulfide oxidoreductase n=1 Tax=Acidobacterium capsulatum (strain ATCC 51196 / DSM 11244 / BCRC 80197 / JCM 7670 / NBRC 15755 / NCIMB 13165 / 161) TaxID=240015 RepID=C1F5T8_ACIC5|nr:MULTISPECIES: FAD/NAD(P)-binding oxidoreductase [Acidobacterium]ACO32415.1 pyridine nucleotide-disulfide oxidoreductase [Acidobacterium capsulatum ATCC 51196]HCT61098.1 NAD(P)/FAD-dependent oxidoreductase [Acidobacterium sp.]
MANNCAYEFDVIVAGGGPAGMAAAWAAAGNSRVAVLDDNPALGGQIWRKALHESGSPLAQEWRRKIYDRRIAFLAGHRIFAAPAKGLLHAEGPDGLCEIRYKKLILATGAREQFLPFPGWTLRGVTGAGGLQALVKSGLPVTNKRIVVAGSGPLLLAVAAHLRQHGAQVLAVCEQASPAQLASFSVALLSHPGKVAEGLRYRSALAGTRYKLGWWPVKAHGRNGQVHAVTMSNGHRKMEISCDLLACSFHLVPNLELPALLGCEILNHGVAVDTLQQTSIAGVYCAGESTGIGGLEKSLIEGEIAGYASSGQVAKAQALRHKRSRAIRFSSAMRRAFALRDELRNLCQPDTLVCRCEDISYERLHGHTSWRAAKLHTRCGMGPCQGRVCGPATDFLFGWQANSTRPPAVPVQVGTLAGLETNPTSTHSIE